MSRYLDALKKEKDWRKQLRMAARSQPARPLDPLFEDIRFALQVVREHNPEPPARRVPKTILKRLQRLGYVAIRWDPALQTALEILQRLGYVVARSLVECYSFTLRDFGHPPDGRFYTLQDLVAAANERSGQAGESDIMRECIIGLQGLFREGSPKLRIASSGKRLVFCGKFGKVTVDDVIANMNRRGESVDGEDPDVRGVIKRAARKLGYPLAPGLPGPKRKPRQKGN